MFPAQLAASALVWAFVVYRLARQRELLVARSASRPRGRRMRDALGRLILSITLLGLGMAALAHGGLATTGMTWWGWPLITLAGAAFIVLQSLALVPLVLNAVEPVTRGEGRSSDTIDVESP